MNFSSIGQIGRNAAKGILGMSAAGTLAAGVLIGPWEGNINTVYYDIGGIPTVCQGVTGKDLYGDPLIAGTYYTNKECDIMNVEAINRHEKNVDRCLPEDKQPPLETKAAYISFDYNTGRFCNSTLGRLASQGKHEQACNQLSRWVFVKGKRVRGLENRRYRGDANRISEKTLCMIGLNKEYKTPLLERVFIAYKNWRSGYEEAEV